jgi:outer membrane protein assembly factor BamB
MVGYRVLILSCFVLFVLVGSSFVGLVWATSVSDWPMFQHDPEHTGYSSIEGPAFGARQAWNYSSGSVIWTSPAVVGGLVYIGSWRGLHCVKESTGQALWNFITEGRVASSAAVANGYVYVGSNAVYDDGYENGTLYCLNASTGELVWSYITGENGRSSPTVVDGYVYIGSRVYQTGEPGYKRVNVFCLDAVTGSHAWNYSILVDDIYGGFSSPAVSNGRVYICGPIHNIYCLNASTGSKIWNHTTANYIASSPAVANNYVYASSANDSVYCLHTSTGELVWNHSIPDLERSSPAVANGCVYIGAGNQLHCLDAFDGTKIWNFTGAWTFRTSPAVDSSRVYAGCYDGNVYCLDVSTGTKLWSYQTGGGPQHGSLAIANGRIYLACIHSFSWFTNETFWGTLYCLEAAPAIPELPSWIILPMFLTITIIVAGYKKKLTKHSEIH